MKTEAAILVEPGKPLQVEEIAIPKLKPGQILAEIAYSGVCHTQLLEQQGYRGTDPWCPHCLGHEATGQVIDVAPDVSKVKAGDVVVLSWLKGEGADVTGTVYDWNGRSVNAGPVTTFAQKSVVSENRAILLPAGLNLLHSVMLGCAAPTGFGSVLNVCRARPGDGIVIFGTGGIGLCAVLAAASVGCDPIVAVDTNLSRLNIAKLFGATHALDAGNEGLDDHLISAKKGGFDFAIEATGRPEVMARAFASVRDRGGKCVVIGNARHGEKLVLDPTELNKGKQLLGTWGGDTDLDRDVERYGQIISDNEANFEAVFFEKFGLRDINQALEELVVGSVGRPVIDMSIKSMV